MSIANKIRALMKTHGFNSRTLAEAMECSPRFISNKLQRDTFTAADLVRIAEVLDCTLSFTLPDGGEILLTTEDIYDEEKKYGK